MHTASQALAIERQASAQPSLAERVSRPKTRAILGLMRLNFLSVSKAAYRFLGKILNNVKKWQIPRFINTDKAPAYGRALALLKREGRCPSDVEHRQIKYRNNVIECDHGKLKRIIGATLGFKSMKTAYATIKGIEVMRALRKGQASAFYYGDPLGEMRLVSRVFEM